MIVACNSCGGNVRHRTRRPLAPATPALLSPPKDSYSASYASPALPGRQEVFGDPPSRCRRSRLHWSKRTHTLPPLAVTRRRHLLPLATSTEIPCPLRSLPLTVFGCRLCDRHRYRCCRSTRRTEVENHRAGRASASRDPWSWGRSLPLPVSRAVPARTGHRAAGATLVPNWYHGPDQSRFGSEDPGGAAP